MIQFEIQLFLNLHPFSYCSDSLPSHCITRSTSHTTHTMSHIKHNSWYLFVNLKVREIQRHQDIRLACTFMPPFDPFCELSCVHFSHFLWYLVCLLVCFSCSLCVYFVCPFLCSFAPSYASMFAPICEQIIALNCAPTNIELDFWLILQRFL